MDQRYRDDFNLDALQGSRYYYDDEDEDGVDDRRDSPRTERQGRSDGSTGRQRGTYSSNAGQRGGQDDRGSQRRTYDRYDRYSSYDDSSYQRRVYDEERERKHRRLMQQMRAEKLRQERRRRFMLRVLLPAGIIILLAAVIFATARSGGKASSAKAEASTAVEAATVTQATDAATAAAAATSQAAVPFSAQKTDSTKDPGVGVGSKYALLIDLATGNILYDRDAETRINPASMTKVLTCLVAVENIKDLDATYKITNEDTDFSYVNGCSQVGFEPGETVTVKDLLYGLILSSGGDAASAIANYTAGSMDDFVTLMNSKLEELGLSGSAHFTNDAGIYDADHYCTAYDMAMIMEAALQNETCREVMSAHVYTTTKTTEHPDGLTISNWFLRRIEDKDCGGTVVCAKTGYVEQSGSCAVSYATGADGKEYLAVTADASSGWRAIYDHVALYKMMFEPDSTIEPATTENASESDTVPADSEGGSSSDGSSAGAGNEGN